MKLLTELPFETNLLILFVASCSGALTQTEKVFEQTHEQLKQLLHNFETKDSIQSPLILEQLKFLLDAYDVDNSKCNRNYLQELRNNEVSYRFNHQLAISRYLDHCEQALVEHCASLLDTFIKGGLEKFNQDEIERIDSLMFHLKNSNLIKGLLSFMIIIPTSIELNTEGQNEAMRARFEFVEKICSNLTTKLGPAFKLYKDDYLDLRKFLAHDKQKWLFSLELCEEISNDRELLMNSTEKLYIREKEKISQIGKA